MYGKEHCSSGLVKDKSYTRLYFILQCNAVSIDACDCSVSSTQHKDVDVDTDDIKEKCQKCEDSVPVSKLRHHLRTCGNSQPITM